MSAALNSGVPLALTGNSEMAAQFDSFTRKILEPEGQLVDLTQAARRVPLGLKSIASIW